MKGPFLASSHRALSLIDFKSGFGNPRHFVSRFSLLPFLVYSFCVTPDWQDSTFRDLICWHVARFVNISWQVYRCPKRMEIDFTRYHNSLCDHALPRLLKIKKKTIAEINLNHCITDSRIYSNCNKCNKSYILLANINKKQNYSIIKNHNPLIELFHSLYNI